MDRFGGSDSGQPHIYRRSLKFCCAYMLFFEKFFLTKGRGCRGLWNLNFFAFIRIYTKEYVIYTLTPRQKPDAHEFIMAGWVGESFHENWHYAYWVSQNTVVHSCRNINPYFWWSVKTTEKVFFWGGFFLHCIDKIRLQGCLRAWSPLDTPVNF